MTTPEIQTVGLHLIIGSVSVKLPSTIQQVIAASNLLVARVDYNAPELKSRNVFGVERSGVIRWQIQRCPDGGDDRDKPYLDLRLDEDQRLIASNWIGVDYLVDQITGGVSAWLPAGEQRRPW